MVNIISYDLSKPGRDYSGLIDAIKKLGGYAHILDSVWIVDTSYSPPDVRNTLKEHLDTNDQLMVIELKNHWAGTGFSEEIYNWLKSSSRSW
jgi:hypothetical protein